MGLLGILEKLPFLAAMSSFMSRNTLHPIAFSRTISGTSKATLSVLLMLGAWYISAVPTIFIVIVSLSYRMR